MVQTAMVPGTKSYGICPGNATFDQVVQTLDQSADVVLGAPQLQDTTKDCDGISVGIGFIARPTGEPRVVAPPFVYGAGCGGV